MEPQLRALGLATTLVRGVPSLNNPHTICTKGERLTSEKCRILKLLAVQMAVSHPGCLFGLLWKHQSSLQEFRIHLGSRWSKDAGFVAGKDVTTESADDDDDEEMADEQ